MDKKRNKTNKHELIHRLRVLKHKAIDAYLEQKSAKVIKICTDYTNTLTTLRRI